MIRDTEPKNIFTSHSSDKKQPVRGSYETKVYRVNGGFLTREVPTDARRPRTDARTSRVDFVGEIKDEDVVRLNALRSQLLRDPANVFVRSQISYLSRKLHFDEPDDQL